MKRVLIVVVIVGVAFAIKMSNRSDDSSDIKNEMRQVIVQMDHYEGENAEFLDDLFERAHERAFREAYAVGGRRSAATFDDEVYVQKLFTWMINECNMRQKRDLVGELQQLRDSY